MKKLVALGFLGVVFGTMLVVGCGDAKPAAAPSAVAGSASAAAASAVPVTATPPVK